MPGKTVRIAPTLESPDLSSGYLPFAPAILIAKGMPEKHRVQVRFANSKNHLLLRIRFTLENANLVVNPYSVL
jgi:hypothetical protein